MPHSNDDNTFVGERDAILMAARDLYLVDQGQMIGDEMTGRVTLLTPELTDISEAGLRQAELHQARVDVAARNIARLASLEDRKAKGGAMGLVANLEIRLTRFSERAYFRDLGAVSLLVEDVRNSGASLPTVE